jgi:hypothetical protein
MDTTPCPAREEAQRKTEIKRVTHADSGRASFIFVSPHLKGRTTVHGFDGDPARKWNLIGFVMQGEERQSVKVANICRNSSVDTDRCLPSMEGKKRR